MWFNSAGACKTYFASPQFDAVRAEEGSFLDVARTVVMPVDVHVIKDGRVPNNAVKNIEFVNKRPSMALAPFRDYWRADMKRGTTTPEYASTRADERNFLPDGHLPIIIAREHRVI